MKLPLLVFGLLLAVSASAGEILGPCDSAWTAGPMLMDDPTNGERVFLGTLTADCAIAHATDGLMAAQAQLIAQATGQGTVVRGPVAEVFAGLPSVLYEIAVSIQEEGDYGTRWQVFHFATDQRSTLIVESHTVKIKGSWKLELLRDQGLRLELTRTRAGFRVRTSSTLRIKKPPIPFIDAQFKSACVDNSQETYRSVRKDVLDPAVAKL